MQQKGKLFHTKDEEMMAFVEMNIMMINHILPELHDYLSNKCDLSAEPIAGIMTRCTVLKHHCMMQTTEKL